MQFSRDGGYTQFATMENPYPVGIIQPWGRDPLAFIGWASKPRPGATSTPSISSGTFRFSAKCRATVAEINYAGSKGTHLYFGLRRHDGQSKQTGSGLLGIGRTALNAQVANPFFGVITDARSILSVPTVPLTGFCANIRSTPAAWVLRNPEHRELAISFGPIQV